MYSDSEFKYASPISEVEYDTDYDSSPESGEYCGGCRNDSGLDYWWDPFVFGFTFFRDERERHYNQLNRYVFRPLSDLLLVNVGISYDFIYDYYKYEVKNMVSQTSEIYRLALRHMEKYDNRLPKK